MLLSMMTLSGCSTNSTVKVPSRYLEPTPYPEIVPKTFGEAVKGLADWKAALDSANADKAAAMKYIEEME